MRTCGECQVCCVVSEIHSDIDGVVVDTMGGSTCAHQCASGCDLHGQPTMPRACDSFGCAWYRGLGGDEDRPDRVGLMLSVSRTSRGQVGVGLEFRPGALLGEGRATAVEFVRTTGMPLVVVEYGKTAPNDVGDWVVLKREHVLKAFSMRGEYVAELAHDVKVYTFAGRRA